MKHSGVDKCRINIQNRSKKISVKAGADGNHKGNCKACKVSTATVSNIMNGKGKASDATKELVLATARKMNYVPNAAAQNLKTKRTRSIGVIVEDMTIFSIPDIVDGITELCDEKSIRFFLSISRLYKKYGDKYYPKTDFYEGYMTK